MFVSFLLDESTSMYSIQEDTMAGLNSYIDGLKEITDKKVLFSLIKFSTRGIEKLYVAESAKNVEVSPAPAGIALLVVP
jgi:hypothetical protein